MKVLNLPDGSVLEIFNSIKEIPALVHNEFQKYVMYDTGIGSTEQDVQNHYNNLMLFLSKNMLDEANEEMGCLYETHFYQLKKINFKSYCFSCLIYSFNKETIPIHEYSEDGLTRLVDKVYQTGITQGMIEETVSEVKKNFGLN